MIKMLEPFGVIDDTPVYLYTISYGNYSASICNFGATLIRLFVPDKNGNPVNVVCGYDSVDAYILNDSYMGAIVLPSANRIRKGQFTLNGKTYQLRINNGPNNLHSSLPGGSAQRIWRLVNYGESELTLQLEYGDGDLGFPGIRVFTVTYALSEEGLTISYSAVSDQDTLFNPTNHSYFNLKGHGTILDHILQINAHYFTPNDADSCPTGEIRAVENTPFDFTQPKPIGQDINQDDIQLVYGNGYDHNWMIDDFDGSLKTIAVLYCEETGIQCETLTSMPGIQVYTANYLGNEKYSKNAAVCLETQFTPDSINLDNQVKPIIKAGVPASHVTVYRFSVKES